MKVAQRQVAMFRCQIDPMIGPKPLNAFVPKDMRMKAEINDEATGVIVTMEDGRQHFVFGANIQSVRLEPEVIEASVTTLKPKLGRPTRDPA